MHSSEQWQLPVHKTTVGSQDQNSALELELADLKTQLDADVAQARQAQNVMAAKAHLEEQLEELWQEVEQLRVKNNALKADNATLLADRAAGGAAAAHSNGDVKSHAPGDGADAGAVATAADLEAARQRIAELEVLLANLQSIALLNCLIALLLLMSHRAEHPFHVCPQVKHTRCWHVMHIL